MSSFNFLGLPPELQILVLMYLFDNSARLSTLIQAHPVLERRFRYLLSRIHTHELVISSDGSVSSSTFLQTVEQSKNITVLKIKPARRRYSHLFDLLGYATSLQLHACLGRFERLALVRIETESLIVLGQLLTNLPPALLFASITYTGSIMGIKHGFPYMCKSLPQKLQYFEFKYKGSEPLIFKPIHLTITRVNPIHLPMEENLSRSMRKKGTVVYHVVALIKGSAQSCLGGQRIGKLINDILALNHLTVRHVLFGRFDPTFIFKGALTPFKMDLLRLFTFDLVVNTHLWVHQFQLKNCHNDPYNDIAVPILVCKDATGDRIYYKAIDETFSYQLGGPSGMYHWHMGTSRGLQVLKNKLDITYLF